MAIKHCLNAPIAIHLAYFSFEPFEKVDTVHPSPGHKSYLHYLNVKYDFYKAQIGSGKILIAQTRVFIITIILSTTGNEQSQLQQLEDQLYGADEQFVFIIMLHLFKSKQYRKANNLLDGLGINTDDFRDFQIEQIAANIKIYESLFPFIVEVMHEIKLSPLKSLKITLLCLQVIHFSRDSTVYELIFQFLHQLQDRVRALLRAKKSVKASISTDSLSTSKEFMEKSAEIVQMDLSSILLERIVIPLICFQQKIIACYEQVYSRDRLHNINEAETWSCINLMRKVVDIGSDIESLGRYYFKETANAVVCLMKVVNSDIQSLYKKIMEYFRKKIATIEILVQENKMNMATIVQKQQLNEFLMMIQELEIINQKLRVLYNGRYFIYHFAKAYVYLPVLFTEDENIDLVYKIKEHQVQQEKKNRSIQAMNRRKKGGQLAQIVQDI